MSLMQIFASYLHENKQKSDEINTYLQKFAELSAISMQENFAFFDVEPTAKNTEQNANNGLKNNVALNFNLVLEKFKQIKTAISHQHNHENSIRNNSIMHQQANNTAEYNTNYPAQYQAQYDSKQSHAQSQNNYGDTLKSQHNIALENISIAKIAHQILAPQKAYYGLEKRQKDKEIQAYNSFDTIANAKQQFDYISQNHIPANMVESIKNQNTYRQQQNSISVAPANITIHSKDTSKSIQQACEKIVQSAFTQSIAAASSGYDDGVLY